MFGIRVLFTILLLLYMNRFLRLRKAIGETVPDLQSFVTDVIFTGTLKALVPVSYVCFTSLGCIVTSYENHSYGDEEIDLACFQELATSVGVALHLVGVCTYQPFLLNNYVEYGISDIIQFTLPLRDKVSLSLITISSIVSMCLFAYRGFDSWRDGTQMFTFVGGAILIIIVIWFVVLGSGSGHVTKLVYQRKLERELAGRNGNGGGGGNGRGSTARGSTARGSTASSTGGGRRSSVAGRQKRGSISGPAYDDDNDEIHNNADQAVGFATGEFGLGVLAPGLV